MGAGLVLWAVDVPVVGHRAFHAITTITPTATQASKPQKNQDANRSANCVIPGSKTADRPKSWMGLPYWINPDEKFSTSQLG
jgi:hypothetical protein